MLLQHKTVRQIPLTQPAPDHAPRLHVAIISDGNGRWAAAKGTRLHLRLAVDYSAREAIYLAACRFYKVTELSPESFSTVLAEGLRGGSTEVDLLIRTGGEQRLSDFLLWECAFAEFVFLQKRWPDFTAEDLEAAVMEFNRRERTRGALGALPDAIAG